MIDWINLAANSLWIVGLAVGLATVSYVSWQASLRRQRTLERLASPAPQIALNLAGLLFCLGLATTSQTSLEFGLWLALAILFLTLMIYNAYKKQRGEKYFRGR
jgi:hypothetical protein